MLGSRRLYLTLWGQLCSNFLSSTIPGLLSNQGEKSIPLLFYNGSFKKKVLKYGTPKPSYSSEYSRFFRARASHCHRDP